MRRPSLFLPHRWPIGVKLFALIASVAVIPLVVGSYLSYEEGRRILREQGLRYSDVFAEKVARSIDFYLAIRMNDVRHGARHLEEGKALLSAKAGEDLDTFLRTFSGFVGVAIADTGGTVRLSAGRRILDSIKKREFFEKALSGSSVVSRPFVEKGRALLAFAAPIRSEGDGSKGVLVALVPAEEFWGIVQQKSEGAVAESVVIVSDRRGIRLAHSTRRDLVFQSWAPLPEGELEDLLSRNELGKDVKTIPATDLPLVQSAVRATNPPRHLTHRLVVGGTYDSVLIPLRQADWIVVNSFPEKSLFAPLQELRREILLYFAIVVTLAVLVSLLATWYALRPARLLTRAAERVRRGDLSVRVDLRRMDEVGKLAETFNSMVEELKADREAIVSSLDRQRILREYYETIIRETTVMVFMVGADDRIKAANRKAEEVLGYGPNELVGSTCDSLQAHPDDRLRRRIARMFEERGRLEREEIPLRAKDGSVRLVLCTLTVVTNPSGENEAAVFGMDVTEERDLQEKWERIEKLASMGQLAAGVAHEMKNYLVPILGYTEMLGERADLADEGRRDLEKIARSVTGLQRLVQQLSGFARPSQERLSPVDLTKVIEEVLSFLRRHLARSRITVELDLGNPLLVLADPAGLEQVFLNLFLNASEAMRDGGTLRVRVASCSDGSVEVIIGDTGPGVSEDDLSRIFTPFFTTKPVGEGTGLGLFVCRQIVERMGGRIGVRSRPGEGTTFTICLSPSAEIA